MRLQSYEWIKNIKAWLGGNCQSMWTERIKFTHKSGATVYNPLLCWSRLWRIIHAQLLNQLAVVLAKCHRWVTSQQICNMDTTNMVNKHSITVTRKSGIIPGCFAWKMHEVKTDLSHALREIRHSFTFIFEPRKLQQLQCWSCNYVPGDTEAILFGQWSLWVRHKHQCTPQIMS